MKNKWPRLLMILAGLLFLLLFLLPIWRISLYAPQYRDGVHMYIYINKIGGKTPGTLQNVNILNHYIGMKPIVPESIPELKVLPYVVIVFTLLALLVAWIDHKYLYYTWLFALVIMLCLGMYDFYLWEYDYGHNLDDNAPMKFEDSFQPPLLGSKKIITFVAQSFPHIGGYIIGLSVMLATIASYLKYKKT